MVSIISWRVATVAVAWPSVASITWTHFQLAVRTQCTAWTGRIFFEFVLHMRSTKVVYGKCK